MDGNEFAIKALLTGIIAAGSAKWGWLGWLAILWALCMALDYFTGTLAAMKKGEWSSAVAREGLWHKGGMILVVCVAALTDLAISLILQSGIAALPFDNSVLLTVITLSWYVLTELGSALENATKLTEKVPAWLTKFLAIAAAAVDRAGERTADGEEPEE